LPQINAVLASVDLRFAVSGLVKTDRVLYIAARQQYLNVFFTNFCQLNEGKNE